MDQRRFRYSALLVLPVLVMALFFPASPLVAQERIDYKDKPSDSRLLSEVLSEYAVQADINLIFDPSIVTDRWTSVPLRYDLPVAQMLAQLLEGTNIKFYRLPSGTYHLTPGVVEISRPTGSLSGRVLDAETGEPLPSALVEITDSPAGPIADVTDGTGVFEFADLKPGEYRMTTRFLGFTTRTDTIQIDAGQRTNVHVILHPLTIDLAPVIVEGHHSYNRLLSLDLLQAFGSSNQSASMGTPDIVRSLNQLMGVRVGDAMSDVHVQAGESGEHQFRLDGFPVFEPVHLRGLLGAFSPFAIKKITVHRAGFGAPYGSHLSGVLMAEHIVAGPEENHFDVQVDPLSLNGRVFTSFQWPGNVTGQLMTAARMSVWNFYQPGLYSPLKELLRKWNTPDTFLSSYILNAPNRLDPQIGNTYKSAIDSLDLSPISDPELGYTDLHSALRLQFSPRHRLYASFYRGANRLNGNLFSVELNGLQNSGPAFDEEQSTPAPSQPEFSANRDGYEWTNTDGQIQYSAILSRKVGAMLRLRGSRYLLHHTYNMLQPGAFQILLTEDGWIVYRLLKDIVPADNGNTISEFALESNLDYAPGARHMLQLGGEAVYTSSRFSMKDDFYLYNPIFHSSKDWRLAVFVEDKATIGNGYTLTAGTRATYLSQGGTTYLEPRLAVGREGPVGAIGRWSWQLSSGIYRQFINQFNLSSTSPSALLSSIRFWVPVDSSVSPQKAYHLAGTLEYAPVPSWLFQLNTYYKKQPHILTIDYPNLLQFITEPVQTASPLDQEVVTDTSQTTQSQFLRSGEGFAYGAAVAMEHTTDRLRFLVRYEYNLAKRTRTLLPEHTPAMDDGFTSPGIDSVNSYERVPWNEPHILDLAVDWTPTKNFSTTIRWRGAWQRKWGFRQAYYDYLANYPIPSYNIGETNFRQPETHDLGPLYQLDVGLAYTHDLGFAAVQLRADVLNVLNRKNIADWGARQVEDENGTIRIEKQPRTLLPRMPSLAVRLTW